MLQRKNESVNNFRCSVIRFRARLTAERLFGDGALSVVLVGRPEKV